VVDTLPGEQKDSQSVLVLRVAEQHLLNMFWNVVLNLQVEQIVERAVYGPHFEKEDSSSVAGRIDRVEFESSGKQVEV
jgi:hypothetical protein